MTNSSIYEKIHRIQFEIGKLKKDGKNPHFKNEYVTLNALNEALQPLLEEHDLMVIQPIIEDRLVTILCERKTPENRFETSISLPDIQDPQRIGSAITYYRRYSLISLFNLQAEDDDAQIASHQTTKTTSNKSSSSSSSNDEINENHPAHANYDWGGRKPIDVKKDKKWLNQYTDKTRAYLSNEFKWATQRLVEGYSINELRNFYMISREVASALEEAKTIQS